jgi:hypothetical protein
MAQQETLESRATIGTPALAGIRILVFSAEADSGARLASALRRTGARILAAQPGIETVQACHTFQPQLIVAACVPYAECARLIETLREAGVAGTAIAVSPAGDPFASGDASDPLLAERFAEELTELLIRLFEESRASS